jgi:hypothetical protein
LITSGSNALFEKYNPHRQITFTIDKVKYVPFALDNEDFAG